MKPDSARTFGTEEIFLRQHTEVLRLAAPDHSGGEILLAPHYQGRVMTSTVAGAHGTSLGWINHELIAGAERKPHINAYGGEERFWIGPEGGQYSIFFAPGKNFTLADWQTPALIDTDAFDTVDATGSKARFLRDGSLTNYAGTRFELRIERAVEVLDRKRAFARLGIANAPGVKIVSYLSSNRLTNRGANAWQRETGLLSIWLLGMYNASPSAVVVVPFQGNATPSPVNDVYFGSPPAERLKVGSTAVYFKGDGAARGKIGLPPAAARNVLGAYDAAVGVLTIVSFDKPAGAVDYVNSLWKVQPDPYGGDVVNAYNDGPPAPGAPQLGKFFELETSSPAAALANGGSIEHAQYTFHLQGDRASLDQVARHVLGVALGDVESAFGR